MGSAGRQLVRQGQGHAGEEEQGEGSRGRHGERGDDGPGRLAMGGTAARRRAEEGDVDDR